jgi:hypothetical protein
VQQLQRDAAGGHEDCTTSATSTEGMAMMIYVVVLVALALALLAFDFVEFAHILGVAALTVLLFALARNDIDSLP